MSHYRIYFLSESGHVLKGQDFDALDDFGALEKAAPLSDDQAIEVWQAARYVARFARGGNAAAPAMTTIPSSVVKRGGDAQL